MGEEKEEAEEEKPETPTAETLGDVLRQYRDDTMKAITELETKLKDTGLVENETYQLMKRTYMMNMDAMQISPLAFISAVPVLLLRILHLWLPRRPGLQHKDPDGRRGIQAVAGHGRWKGVAPAMDEQTAPNRDGRYPVDKRHHPPPFRPHQPAGPQQPARPQRALFEVSTMDEPLFTVIALRSQRFTLRAFLRCNTCGNKDIEVSMVLGYKFHCPTCKKEEAMNRITSVLPFVVERLKKEGTTDVEVQGVH